MFNSLFDPHDSEIYLKPVSNYVKTGQSISFFTVVDAALRQNETVIGYRINSKNGNSNQKYKTILNPDKKTVLEFSSDDKIIVIADDRDSSQ